MFNLFSSWVRILILLVIFINVIYTQEKVIFDTDIILDWDDTGATATLQTLADVRETGILAKVVSNGGYSAIWRQPSLDSFTTRYSRPDILNIVAENGPDFGSRHNQQITLEFPQDLDLNVTWNVFELYRMVLAEQEDSIVVIIASGFINNTADLLSSESVFQLKQATNLFNIRIKSIPSDYGLAALGLVICG